MTTANALKRHRLAHGFSQSRLAELAGCTNSAVSLWESGQRTPRARYQARLEHALSLPIGTLTND